ncbi:MAG: DUF3108 domain-containing protein [Acidobacteriota bacterium]|nr:DUF3108 domain-containing protein [Acidobacteriota bacterium]
MRARLSLAVMLPLLAQAPRSGAPSRETLDYEVEWRLVTAGKARLSWYPSGRDSNSGWEAKLHLESIGLISRMFHVNDDYTANLDSNFCAESTFLTAHEGSRNRETKVTYDSTLKKAGYLEKDLSNNSTVATREIDIPPCVHDILGGLYLLRTLNIEPGHSTQLTVSDGKKNVLVKVESQRREDLKTAQGVQKTILYEIFVFNNVLYRRPGHLHIWLTDDSRRVPVQFQIRLQFTIGTITLRLQKDEKS